MQETVPTTAVEAATLALLVPCGHCWAPPGVPCTVSGPSGQHLARYLRAERKGLLDRQALAAVVGGLDVIAPHVIVPDVTP
jgi:hypothetical protein